MKHLLVLLIGLLFVAGSSAQTRPDSSCKLVTLMVFADESTDLVLVPKDYLQCLIRGASARVVIQETHSNMTSYPIWGIGDEYYPYLSAWEFYGSEIACAARTNTEAKMATKTLILQNLPEAEALCEFFVDPQTGRIELPSRPIEKSSAGVSNNF